jgi:photosynthetic reaction center H subunit
MVHASSIGHLDVAQFTIWAFWIFFAILCFWLRQEDRREGYPLVNDATGKMKDRGFLYIPQPKTFRLASGATVQAPNCEADTRPVNGTQVESWPGAPIEPNGNPLTAGVGPGSWNVRPDIISKTMEGQNLIAPLRVATHFAVPSEQKSPVGFKVIGADGKAAGTVKDLWVDRGESQVRYFELALDAGGVVLAPVCFADISRKSRSVKINALTSAQFAGVPKTKASDSVTLLEEEKIAAYYGAGTLYATPDRAEPFL